MRFVDLVIARIGIGGTNWANFRAELCRKFTEAEQICGLSREEAQKMREKPIAEGKWQPEIALAGAERDQKIAEARGIKWVSIVEEDFPPLLREMHNPPAVLFYKGELPQPDKPLAAIVGTRKPSSPACRWTYKTARGLALAGVNTVSGLALGIDAQAHRGCLDGGGATIAVLGTAIDCVFPPSNAPLARRIVSRGGLLLSEYPLGSTPTKWTFPERNRIIAGLSRAVIVAEAPERSGGLITARHALDENRDVWVGRNCEKDYVSGGQVSVFGAGCENLAAEGARVMTGAADLLDDWKRPRPRPPKPQNPEEQTLAGQLALELGLI